LFYSWLDISIFNGIFHNRICQIGIVNKEPFLLFFTLKSPVFPNKLKARGQAKPAPEPKKKNLKCKVKCM